MVKAGITIQDLRAQTSARHLTSIQKTTSHALLSKHQELLSTNSIIANPVQIPSSNPHPLSIEYAGGPVDEHGNPIKRKENANLRKCQVTANKLKMHYLNARSTVQISQASKAIDVVRNMGGEVVNGGGGGDSGGGSQVRYDDDFRQRGGGGGGGDRRPDDRDNRSNSNSNYNSNSNNNNQNNYNASPNKHNSLPPHQKRPNHPPEIGTKTSKYSTSKVRLINTPSGLNSVAMNASNNAANKEYERERQELMGGGSSGGGREDEGRDNPRGGHDGGDGGGDEGRDSSRGGHHGNHQYGGGGNFNGNGGGGGMNNHGNQHDNYRGSGSGNGGGNHHQNNNQAGGGNNNNSNHRNNGSNYDGPNNNNGNNHNNNNNNNNGYNGGGSGVRMDHNNNPRPRGGVKNRNNQNYYNEMNGNGRYNDYNNNNNRGYNNGNNEPYSPGNGNGGNGNNGNYGHGNNNNTSNSNSNNNPNSNGYNNNNGNNNNNNNNTSSGSPPSSSASASAAAPKPGSLSEAARLAGVNALKLADERKAAAAAAAAGDAEPEDGGDDAKIKSEGVINDGSAETPAVVGGEEGSKDDVPSSPAAAPRTVSPTSSSAEKEREKELPPNLAALGLKVVKKSDSSGDYDISSKGSISPSNVPDDDGNSGNGNGNGDNNNNQNNNQNGYNNNMNNNNYSKNMNKGLNITTKPYAPNDRNNNNDRDYDRYNDNRSNRYDRESGGRGGNEERYSDRVDREKYERYSDRIDRIDREKYANRERYSDRLDREKYDSRERYSDRLDRERYSDRDKYDPLTPPVNSSHSHGLTVQELKEMTKARLASEDVKKTEDGEVKKEKSDKGKQAEDTAETETEGDDEKSTASSSNTAGAQSSNPSVRTGPTPDSDAYNANLAARLEQTPLPPGVHSWSQLTPTQQSQHVHAYEVHVQNMHAQANHQRGQIAHLQQTITTYQHQYSQAMQYAEYYSVPGSEEFDPMEARRHYNLAQQYASAAQQVAGQMAAAQRSGGGYGQEQHQQFGPYGGGGAGYGMGMNQGQGGWGYGEDNGMHAQYDEEGNEIEDPASQLYGEEDSSDNSPALPISPAMSNGPYNTNVRPFIPAAVRAQQQDAIPKHPQDLPIPPALPTPPSNSVIDALSDPPLKDIRDIWRQNRSSINSDSGELPNWIAESVLSSTPRMERKLPVTAFQSASGNPSNTVTNGLGDTSAMSPSMMASILTQSGSTSGTRNSFDFLTAEWEGLTLGNSGISDSGLPESSLLNSFRNSQGQGSSSGNGDNLAPLPTLPPDFQKDPSSPNLRTGVSMLTRNTQSYNDGNISQEEFESRRTSIINDIDGSRLGGMGSGGSGGGSGSGMLNEGEHDEENIVLGNNMLSEGW